MKYAVEMGLGNMAMFHREWFRHSKVDRETNRQYGDLISVFSFIPNKESMLKRRSGFVSTVN